jgi:hypothetical protein
MAELGSIMRLVLLVDQAAKELPAPYLRRRL